MEEWKERFPLPIYKKALKILRMEESCHLPPTEVHCPITPFIPCYMASSSSKVPDVNNEDEYPPLTPYTSSHGVPFRPYTKLKIVKPNGSFEPLSSAEEVLNWQTKSHIAQRRHLVRQDEKLDKLLHAVEKQES